MLGTLEVYCPSVNKYVKVGINGGTVTINGRQLELDDPLRMQIISSLYPLNEIVNSHALMSQEDAL